MTDETIRTLITAVAAVLTTALTVWFALRSQERRDRISKLESELRNAFQEFILLYKTEEEYLTELAGLKNKTCQSLKIATRRIVTDKHEDDKITLTPDSIKKKIKELGLK